jgi:hypothetical protein
MAPGLNRVGSFLWAEFNNRLASIKLGQQEFRAGGSQMTDTLNLWRLR